MMQNFKRWGKRYLTARGILRDGHCYRMMILQHPAMRFLFVIHLVIIDAVQIVLGPFLQAQHKQCSKHGVLVRTLQQVAVVVEHSMAAPVHM
jgi:hypothetical protein